MFPFNSDIILPTLVPSFSSTVTWAMEILNKTDSNNEQKNETKIAIKKYIIKKVILYLKKN